MALSDTHRARGLWWLSPAGAVTLIVLPTLLLAVRLSDDRFRAAWGTPRWLQSSYVMLLLAGTLVFAATSMLPLLARRVPRSAPWPGRTSLPSS
jgi:hypothetical protein